MPILRATSVAVIHIEADVRMALREVEQQRCQPFEAKAQRQADADVATRCQAFLGDIGFGRLNQIQDDPALFQVGRAGRSQRQPARAARHQLDPQVCFERRDLPGHH